MTEYTAYNTLPPLRAAPAPPEPPLVQPPRPTVGISTNSNGHQHQPPHAPQYFDPHPPIAPPHGLARPTASAPMPPTSPRTSVYFDKYKHVQHPRRMMQPQPLIPPETRQPLQVTSRGIPTFANLLRENKKLKDQIRQSMKEELILDEMIVKKHLARQHGGETGPLPPEVLQQLMALGSANLLHEVMAEQQAQFSEISSEPSHTQKKHKSPRRHHKKKRDKKHKAHPQDFYEEEYHQDRGFLGGFDEGEIDGRV
eukprot:TRINITY_DN67836_c9_g4_i1.p1 TRINITY_DN67836_c9_g4~~TRINITY_DN67836_c9_g4_i1.p1  ORF type:complete len:254 (-),score=13.69 TRINITY_DN67836_c9_g4_i1:276-1037(-)